MKMHKSLFFAHFILFMIRYITIHTVSNQCISSKLPPTLSVALLGDNNS